MYNYNDNCVILSTGLGNMLSHNVTYYLNLSIVGGDGERPKILTKLQYVRQYQVIEYIYS